MSNYYCISNDKEYRYCADIQLDKTISEMIKSDFKGRVSLRFASEQEYLHSRALEEVESKTYTEVTGLITKSGHPILYIKLGQGDEGLATSTFIVKVGDYLEIRRSSNQDLMGGNV